MKRDYTNYTDRICLFDGIETRRKLIRSYSIGRGEGILNYVFPSSNVQLYHQTKTLEGHLQWTKTCKARWNPLEITRFLKSLLSIHLRALLSGTTSKKTWWAHQSSVVHQLPPPKAKNIWVNHHLPTSMYGIKNETNVGKYTSHMDPVGYRTHHLHLIDFSHFCLAWHAKRFPAWLPPLMTSKKNEEPDFVWRIRNEKNAKL